MTENTLEEKTSKAKHNCSHLVFITKCKLQQKVCIELLGENDPKSYFACEYKNPKKCNNYSPCAS